MESDDYETIAGWLMDTLDYVPKPGDELMVGGYSFRIEQMRRSRISTIKVERLCACEAEGGDKAAAEEDAHASV